MRLALKTVERHFERVATLAERRVVVEVAEGHIAAVVAVAVQGVQAVVAVVAVMAVVAAVAVLAGVAVQAV